YRFQSRQHVSRRRRSRGGRRDAGGDALRSAGCREDGSGDSFPSRGLALGGGPGGPAGQQNGQRDRLHGHPHWVTRIESRARKSRPRIEPVTVTSTWSPGDKAAATALRSNLNVTRLPSHEILFRAGTAPLSRIDGRLTSHAPTPGRNVRRACTGSPWLRRLSVRGVK